MSESQNALDTVYASLQSLKQDGRKFRASLDSLERLRATGETGVPPQPAHQEPERRSAISEPRTISPTPKPRPNAPNILAQFAAAPAPSPVIIPAGNPDSDKAQRLAALRTPALACTKCPSLAASRKQVVFGVGNPDAQLMFIGEAPGADEDLVGEPFVGKAGQLLTKMIDAMGLRRSDVYVAYILKCRPDMPGEVAGSRKPTVAEMEVCKPYLVEQIKIIDPKVIVALGASAVEGLLGETESISKLRGHWRTLYGIPLMPTFHPAYLARNQSMAEKRKVWEDMLQIMEKLGLEISAKQRGFFLPKS